jgi:hypothetical protein
MYDVLFLNRTHGERVLASGLAREDACQIARAESERRGVGRMFLAGSELDPSRDLVLIVESRQQVA